MQVCSTATVNKPTEIQTELDKHENNLITDDDNDFSLMDTNEKYPQPHWKQAKHTAHCIPVLYLNLLTYSTKGLN